MSRRSVPPDLSQNGTLERDTSKFRSVPARHPQNFRKRAQSLNAGTLGRDTSASREIELSRSNVPLSPSSVLVTFGTN